MIHLQLVIMLEVLSTVGTAPVLFFEQSGYAGLHRRVVSPAATPIHPIPIVRTPIARNLGMKEAGDLIMVDEPHLAVGSHWCGKHLPGVPSVPVPVVNPCCRGVGVSPGDPAAEFHPYQMVQATKSRLADPGTVIVGPTPDVGVKFPDESCLRPILALANNPTELRSMALTLALAGVIRVLYPRR